MSYKELADAIQKLPKRIMVLVGSDHGSFFMTIAFDFQEILRGTSRIVDFPPETERQNRVLMAMHDEYGNVDFFESFFDIEWRAQEQSEPGPGLEN